LAKLVINPTSATKKEIPIVSRVISIGRDPSNDLVLSDSMVSRRHAILEHRDNQYILRDNNSSNGTMVNGDRVDMEKPLRDGDLVAIGSSRLLFQLDETAEASIPAAAAAGKGAALPAARPGPPDVAPAPARVPGEGDVRCGHCGKTALVGDRFRRRGLAGDGFHGIEPWGNELQHYLNQPPEVFKRVLDESGIGISSVASGGEYFDTARLKTTIETNSANAKLAGR